MTAGIGILGHVSAYFGTVESQGRGTLHLHPLLWLDGAPSADDMCEWFKDEGFHVKVKSYIHANLHAYLPGLEDCETVKVIPKMKDIAYNHPLDPALSEYCQ